MLWALGQWPLDSLVRVQQLQLLRASALAAMLKYVPLPAATPPAPGASVPAAGAAPAQAPPAISASLQQQQQQQAQGGPATAPAATAVQSPEGGPPAGSAPGAQALQLLPWAPPPLGPTLLTDLAVGLAQVGCGLGYRKGGGRGCLWLRRCCLSGGCCLWALCAGRAYWWWWWCGEGEGAACKLGGCGGERVWVQRGCWLAAC